MTTLPPLGSALSKPPAEPLLHSAPRAEPPAPEPANRELPKPVISEPKPVISEQKPVISEPKPAGLVGASLPSISNLDAPPQPPKEPAPVTAPGFGKPAETAPGLNKPAETATGLNKPVEAAAPGLSAPAFPKPVEVKSVPQTPINDRTPAGGTPRPELDISQEPVQKPESDKPATLPEAKAATSVPKPESSLNGAKEPAPTPAPTPALGQKRKFEDEAESKLEHTEKKAKAEESKAASNGATETAAAPAAEAPAATSAPKKAGRPKKKKTAAPVGQTQRKTRSQGPVEGGL